MSILRVLEHVTGLSNDPICAECFDEDAHKVNYMKQLWLLLAGEIVVVCEKFLNVKKVGLSILEG